MSKTAIQIIRELAGTNEEASKLWQASFDPKLSLIVKKPVFNPVVIANYCEKNNKTLTEEEKNIIFI
jgi:hypothetical protein